MTCKRKWKPPEYKSMSRGGCRNVACWFYEFDNPKNPGEKKLAHYCRQHGNGRENTFKKVLSRNEYRVAKIMDM